MAYTPTAYTTAASVKRLLRTVNNKIRIGDQPNDTLSSADLDEYILDASRFIDSMIRKVCASGEVPLTTNYSEIDFAAPRIAAYLIYRSLFQSYRWENLPMGPRGWITDAQDFLKIFMDNLDNGFYPGLSPSTGGPSWETAETFFQTKIGVAAVHTQVGNVTDQAPNTSGDNIGPYSENTCQ